MTEYRRYAIYYAPPPGAFARRSAHWLGWDAQAGQTVDQPDLPGLPRPLAELTGDPRKYGFHGTIKAPFRLAEGMTRAGLSAALDELGARLAPVLLPGLHLVQIGGFLALVPQGDDGKLKALAFDAVTALDRFRAPLTEAEIAKRRPDRLTARQCALLERWGYPYVDEEFRFHLTLSDKLEAAEGAALAQVAASHFADCLPQPFVIGDLCLFGEDAAGRFHLVARHALAG